MTQSDSTTTKSFVNIQIWDHSHDKTYPFHAQADTSIPHILISQHQAKVLGFTIDPYSGDETVAIDGKPIRPTGQIHAKWKPKTDGEDLSDDFYLVDDLSSDVLIGKKRWDDVKDIVEKPKDAKEEPQKAPTVDPETLPGPWIWSMDQRKFFKIDRSSGKARLVFKEE